MSSHSRRAERVGESVKVLEEDDGRRVWREALTFCVEGMELS